MPDSIKDSPLRSFIANNAITLVMFVFAAGSLYSEVRTLGTDMETINDHLESGLSRIESKFDRELKTINDRQRRKIDEQNQLVDDLHRLELDIVKLQSYIDNEDETIKYVLRRLDEIQDNVNSNE